MEAELDRELNKPRDYRTHKIAWTAATIALTAVSLNAAFAQSAVSSPANHRLAQAAIFGAKTSSSGWIDFTASTSLGIYLPVKINGHEAMALLWGGPSSIDQSFATSIGLDAKADAAGGMEVRVGDLVLRNASAKPDD